MITTSQCESFYPLDPKSPKFEILETQTMRKIIKNVNFDEILGVKPRTLSL